MKEDDPKAALNSFQRVLDLEEEKGEWGFKALKQMIKINFRVVRVIQIIYKNYVDYCLMFVLFFKGKLCRNDESIQTTFNIY